MSKAALVALAIGLLSALSGGQLRGDEVGVNETSTAAGAAVAPPVLDIFSMIERASVEQRARMSRFLVNKHPTLATDLFEVFAAQAPEALGEVSGYIDHLVKTKYPQIPTLISAELQMVPAVRSTVVQVISEKYPELVADLREVPAGENVQTRAAQLINEKYPELLKDVLGTITLKFSGLLVSLQHKVISNHPEIVIDVARMVQEKYPGLTNEVLILLLTKYPDVLPGLIAVLTGPPAADSAEAQPDGAGALDPGARETPAVPAAPRVPSEAIGESAEGE